MCAAVEQCIGIVLCVPGLAVLHTCFKMRALGQVTPYRESVASSRECFAFGRAEGMLCDEGHTGLVKLIATTWDCCFLEHAVTLFSRLAEARVVIWAKRGMHAVVIIFVGVSSVEGCISNSW